MSRSIRTNGQARSVVVDKREAILRAAIKVFAGKGFFSSRVADIAGEAGIADGTVYLYFKSKEDILHSVFDALNYKSGGEWQKISSGEMLSRAENIALGLYSIGLRKSDRAAILAANSPEWTLTDAGCQLAGVIDVPVYTTLAPNSICYIIKDSGAKVFFLQDRETLSESKKFCPNVKL